MYARSRSCMPAHWVSNDKMKNNRKLTNKMLGNDPRCIKTNRRIQTKQKKMVMNVVRFFGAWHRRMIPSSIPSLHEDEITPLLNCTLGNYFENSSCLSTTSLPLNLLNRHTAPTHVYHPPHRWDLSHPETPASPSNHRNLATRHTAPRQCHPPE